MMGERLKEERKRLDYSQESFAALAGITRIPYREWEKGNTVPNALHLAALGAAGADVLYILTGRREITDIAAREAALLDNYRHSPNAGKEAIERTAFALAEPENLKKGKTA
ncbi:MAG: helix-turn-helix domain-containing protein [Azoarcus sp.]|jgi:transcriptional regulator with XRE-family HTH domain|nr:helix-turn-helix domain-containing protein [Azoarcus sp.]